MVAFIRHGELPAHEVVFVLRELPARIAAGGQVTRAQYEAGLARTARCRERMVDLFRECDGLIAPSAPGEAPRGLERTGEPIFGLMWTLLGLPCITLPCGAGPNGLPLGVQLIGRHGGDAGTEARDLPARERGGLDRRTAGREQERARQDREVGGR